MDLFLNLAVRVASMDRCPEIQLYRKIKLFSWTPIIYSCIELIVSESHLLFHWFAMSVWSPSPPHDNAGRLCIS